MNQKAIYNEATLGEVHGPYVQGTKYRDLFFTTQIPSILPDGDIISQDPYEQTIQCLKNAELALNEVGATLADVLTCRIYLTDFNDYGIVNQAYREMMPDSPFPTRACVQIAGMYPEVRVEMEFIASCPE